jgi:hypothetical protein
MERTAGHADQSRDCDLTTRTRDIEGPPIGETGEKEGGSGSGK